MRNPDPEIQHWLGHISDACDAHGWTLEVDHVSTHGTTAYCQLVRPSDGHKARLRVSDHRSWDFKTGKYYTPKGIQRMAFNVLTFRPATFAHFVRWLRSKRARP